MSEDPQFEREVRAARNQSLFRAVNAKLVDVDAPSARAAATFAVSCECADLDCFETVEVDPKRYLEVRRSPRRFVVLPGHVFPEVEQVVGEFETFTVVEKTGAAAEMAEALSDIHH